MSEWSWYGSRTAGAGGAGTYTGPPQAMQGPQGRANPTPPLSPPVPYPAWKAIDVCPVYTSVPSSTCAPQQRPCLALCCVVGGGLTLFHSDDFLAPPNSSLASTGAAALPRCTRRPWAAAAGRLGHSSCRSGVRHAAPASPARDLYAMPDKSTMMFFYSGAADDDGRRSCSMPFHASPPCVPPSPCFAWLMGVGGCSDALTACCLLHAARALSPPPAAREPRAACSCCATRTQAMAPQFAHWLSENARRIISCSCLSRYKQLQIVCPLVVPMHLVAAALPSPCLPCLALLCLALHAWTSRMMPCTPRAMVGGVRRVGWPFGAVVHAPPNPSYYHMNLASKFECELHP